MRGGATWNSSCFNHDQLRDCANLLGKRVPVIILLMLDNPGALWGMVVIRLLFSQMTAIGTEVT